MLECSSFALPKFLFCKLNLIIDRIHSVGYTTELVSDGIFTVILIFVRVFWEPVFHFMYHASLQVVNSCSELVAARGAVHII